MLQKSFKFTRLAHNYHGIAKDKPSPAKTDQFDHKGIDYQEIFRAVKIFEKIEK